MCASRLADKDAVQTSSEHHADDLYAVIPAAGSGRRMNHSTPKQYIELKGVSILQRTISRLLQIESIKKIIVVVDEASHKSIDAVLLADDSAGTQSAATQKKPKTESRIETCVGGASRVDSVRNGLLHLQKTLPSTARVLVHDAARPCVSITDINQLVSEVRDDVNGGLLAMPVSDTIKLAKDGRAVETVDRQALWRAATPQLFTIGLLLNAIEKAMVDGIELTDEASAMQHSGYKPKLIECRSDNIKITTATDLVLAEQYLLAQDSEASHENKI